MQNSEKKPPNPAGLSLARHAYHVGPHLCAPDTAPSPVANAAGFWSGAIDDVALFDQALTADQIALVYNAGLAGTPVGALRVPEASTLALSLVVAMALGSRCLVNRRKRLSA